MAMLTKLFRSIVAKTTILSAVLIFDTALIAILVAFFVVEQQLEQADILADAHTLLAIEAKAVQQYSDDIFQQALGIVDQIDGILVNKSGGTPENKAGTWAPLDQRVRGVAEIKDVRVVVGTATVYSYRRDGEAQQLPANLEASGPRYQLRSQHETAIGPWPGGSSNTFVIERKLKDQGGRPSRILVAFALYPDDMLRPMMFIASMPRAIVRLVEEEPISTGAARGQVGRGQDVINEAHAVDRADLYDDRTTSNSDWVIASQGDATSPFVSSVSLRSGEILSYWQRDRGKMLVLLLCGSALMLLMTAPIKSYVARPLVELKGAVMRIAQGDLGRPIDRHPAFADIDEVGRGVELMRRSLHRLTSDLNAQVGEKTRELSTRNEQLDLALESMGHGLFMLDEDGRLILWNKRVLRKLDLSSGLLRPGVPLKALTRHARRVRELSMPWRQALTLVARLALDRVSCSYTLLLPDGRAIEVIHKSVAIGSVSTLSDVTERRSAFRRLATIAADATRANQAKTRFLENMSHELRTPLNAIIGFSELIESQAFGAIGQPKYVEYIAHIRESAQHLLMLINGLLDTARIEAGSEKMREEIIDLAMLLRWVEAQLRHSATQSGVALDVRIPAEPVKLKADNTRLRQAVLNVAGNAVKFTPSGGKVIVNFYVDRDGNLDIIVLDTGIGIAPDDLTRVLLPFEQADTRLGRRFEGAGLGLPIAKALIEMHGGEFRIASVLGKGTEVIMKMPRERRI